MADSRSMLIAALLLATSLASAVEAQPQESSQVPDQFVFFEGHAYMGSDSVKWDHDKLVLAKRVADLSGKGSFVEKTEELRPTPDAWQLFWARIDSIGTWQWKLSYSDSKRDGPDGESWSLTIRHGSKQVKSKGYNAAPDAYREFRDALSKLMDDARRNAGA